MEEKLSSYFKLVSKAFGNAVVKLINIIFDTIRIIVSFIRSPIGWAIITIIVFCIVVSIILFMILPLFGVNIIKDDKKKMMTKTKIKIKIKLNVAINLKRMELKKIGIGVIL